VLDPQGRLDDGHVCLGSDQPFIGPSVHEPQAMLADALRTGTLTQAQHHGIVGANALAFLVR